MSENNNNPALLNDSNNMEAIKRLRKLEPKMFAEICKMHLSRLVDLSGDYSEPLLNMTIFGSKPAKSKRIKGKDVHVMNGAPLTQEGICRIYQLIEFLQQDFNLKQKSIFRVAGTISRQDHLRYLLDVGTPLNLDSMTFNIHDCCCVLKNFFGEMQEPLLCSDLFKIYLKIGELIFNQFESYANKMKVVQISLLLLPDENYILFHQLLNLLQRVHQQSDLNLMDAESLSIIFVPILICPRDLNPGDLKELVNQVKPMLRFMIENVPNIFDVPSELVRDITGQLEAFNNGTMSKDDALLTGTSYCRRQMTSKFYTQLQVHDLLTDIQSMPQCSQKKLFLKRMKEQKGQITPMPERPVKRNRTQSVGDSLKKLWSGSIKKGKPVIRRTSSCDRIATRLSKDLDSTCMSPKPFAHRLKSLRFPTSVKPKDNKTLF